MLTRCNPNPEGPSELWDLAPVAGREAAGGVGRLRGWMALGFNLDFSYLLTVGPWLRSQSLGFFIWKGTVSTMKWNHGSVWYRPGPHSVGAPGYSLSQVLCATTPSAALLPPPSVPTAQRLQCVPLFNQHLNRSADPQQHCFNAASPC